MNNKFFQILTGFALIAAFLGNEKTVNAAMHDNPSIEFSQPPRTGLKICRNLEVECFYVNNNDEVQQSGKKITVPGYFNFPDVPICVPKKNTFAAMNAACAALGPVNGYPLFASGLGKPTTVQIALQKACQWSEWDKNNRVCCLPTPAQEQETKMKWEEPLHLPTPTPQDRSPIPSEPERNLKLVPMGERTLQE